MRDTYLLSRDRLSLCCIDVYPCANVLEHSALMMHQAVSLPLSAACPSVTFAKVMSGRLSLAALSAGPGGAPWDAAYLVSATDESWSTVSRRVEPRRQPSSCSPSRAWCPLSCKSCRLASRPRTSSSLPSRPSKTSRPSRCAPALTHSPWSPLLVWPDLA